jgi:hypothetical protein
MRPPQASGCLESVAFNTIWRRQFHRGRTRIGTSSREEDDSVIHGVLERPAQRVRQAQAGDPLAGVLDSPAGSKPIVSPVPAEVRPGEACGRQGPVAATAADAVGGPPIGGFTGWDQPPVPRFSPSRPTVHVAHHVPDLTIGSAFALHEAGRVRKDPKRQRRPVGAFQARIGPATL